MGKDVYIKLDELKSLAGELEDIRTELEGKDNLQDQLKEAIGQPMGRYELRSKVGSTESQWSSKRKKLREGLEEVAKRMNGVIEEVEKADKEMAIQLEAEDDGGGSGGGGTSASGR